MKNNILLCIILLITISGKAQEKTSERSRNLLYYFNGGVGVYIPLSTHGALSETGAVGSFQFQVDYKKHLFGRLFFDQYNIAFHSNFVNKNGIDVLIQGKIPSSLIGLEMGYRWHINRFSPYTYMGTGVEITDIPVLKESTTSNGIKLTTDSQSSLAFRAGVGLNYKISKLFIIYCESQFLSFPITTQVYNGMLNGVSLQIGFKTPLQ